MNRLVASILISNHTVIRLEEIFNELFSNPLSDRIEIVFADEPGDSKTWNIINKFILAHPSQITATRNRVALGLNTNFINLLRMSKCRVYAVSNENNDFSISIFFNELSEYLNEGFSNNFTTLNQKNTKGKFYFADQNHSYIYKNKPWYQIFDNNINPLVSITIHNYNYGRFLRECLLSVVNQTYKNIQILFSDNASDDNSWSIANEFYELYPSKFSVTRNRQNFGSKDNIQNCEFYITGDYYLQLCSDDFLAHDCIERCIDAFRKHPLSAMLIMHRSICDSEGNINHEKPFFNRSFCGNPGSIADVYLMSSINPSISQIIYNTNVLPQVNRTIIDRWFSNRFRDFLISLDNPVLYLADPLLIHRIHGSNDSIECANNLLEVIGPYVANIEFELIANEKSYSLNNSSIWRDKLSMLCLRYSYRSLLAKDTDLSIRYFHLAAAISTQVTNSDDYVLLQNYFYGSESERVVFLNRLKLNDHLRTRIVSYDPPDNSICI